MKTTPKLHYAIKGHPKRWHIETDTNGEQVRVVEEFTITGITLTHIGLCLDCSPEGAEMLASYIRESNIDDVMREVYETIELEGYPDPHRSED